MWEWWFGLGGGAGILNYLTGGVGEKRLWRKGGREGRGIGEGFVQGFSGWGKGL